MGRGLILTSLAVMAYQTQTGSCRLVNVSMPFSSWPSCSVSTVWKVEERKAVVHSARGLPFSTSFAVLAMNSSRRRVWKVVTSNENRMRFSLRSPRASWGG